MNFDSKVAPLAAQMYNASQVWTYRALLMIWIFFMKSLCLWQIYNIWQSLKRLDNRQQKQALPIQVGSNLVMGLLLWLYKYRTPAQINNTQ